MLETFIKASDEYTQIGRSVPAPYIRKKFHMPFSPEQARLYIAASGFYELYLDGKNITKGALAPYISNPDDMLCYDAYDLTEALSAGDHAIGIILGNGFANQSIREWDFCKASFRAPLCCAVELRAEGEGQAFRLCGDESFKTHPSHILYDMYRYGTHADGRQYLDGWAEADFDDSGWENAMPAQPPRGQLVPCTAAPIRCRYELKPVKITWQENVCYLKTALHGGEEIPATRVSGYLYDFGKNRAGVCRLRIRGKAGQRIKLRHCERLDDDGHFNVNSVYTFRQDHEDYIHLFQTDVYILSGKGEEEFTPPFTYHGFRYVLVEGLFPEQATEELLTFTVLSSDIRQRADFECSHQTLNTLYDMGIHADLSNFYYFPTDCPHREKNGWTGDISASAEQLLLHFDCGEDLRLWLKTLAYAQREDGSLPGIAPTGGWGFQWGNGPMWDSACGTVPYCIYKYDGRTDVLEECAGMIDKYLHYIASRRDEKGLVAVGLGDWCQPRPRGEKIAAPLAVTDSMTVYEMAVKSARIFEVIGQRERMAYAETLAGEMKQAILTHLYDSRTGDAEGNCQTSQVLILANKLLEPADARKAYVRLTERIREKDDHIGCGMIGLRFLFEELILGGDADLALKLICREDPPSYGAMIRRGATALCEALMENGLNESENHHFFGDILRVFHGYLAGLRVNPDLRDPNHAVFSPVIPKCLDFARGSYTFPSGTACFGWERENGGVKAYVTLPPGVYGEFSCRGRQQPLTPGYQEFWLTE